MDKPAGLPARFTHTEHVPADEVQVVTDLDRLHDVYDELELDSLLEQYATRRNTSNLGVEDTLSDEIEDALDVFSAAIVGVAVDEEGPNVDLVRQAFDRVNLGMNRAIAHLRGVPTFRRNIADKVLRRSGVEAVPTTMQPLDDQFWNEQFPREYAEETWVKRQPDESEQVYAARYIAFCLRRYRWASFSYIG